MPKVRVATGFYTNCDSFVEVTPELLKWIRTSEKTSPSGTVINSLEEASCTLAEALKSGGREHLISEELYSKLCSQVGEMKKRLGGNGFHMGCALHQLGLTPLVSYPCRPKGIMQRSPEVKVAVEGSFKKPLEAVRPEDPEYDHIIFEFKENLPQGVEMTGRHILSWDLMSFHGIYDEEFQTFAFDRNFTDILIFGYAHLLLPEYREKTDEISDSLGFSGRPRVHMEFGQGSEESMKYAMKIFSDRHCTDSWGLNDEECKCYFGARSNRIEDLKEATLKAAKDYGVDRICIHTPRFAFSISKCSVEKEAEALQQASRVSAALTMGGISQNLRAAGSLPTTDQSQMSEKLEGYNFTATPVYVNDEPKILTGLGDAFAAVQAAIALAE